MSAVVHPKCGHVSHLMEVDCFEGSPQVHLHFLTEPAEYSLIGFMKIELCCHGCGESILVYYDEPEDANDARHINLRNQFHHKHRLCPDRGYSDLCPNYRSRFETVDLRPVKKERFNGPRTHIRRRSAVPTPGPIVPGKRRSSVRKETAKG